MAQELNNRHAALLWEMMGVSVTNCRALPKEHAGGVTFLGYFDLQVWVFPPIGEALPLIQLVGNSLKTIGNDLHFDPKAERAKDDRPGARKFFNHWFPMSRAAREVLTRKLADLPEIQEMVQKSKENAS